MKLKITKTSLLASKKLNHKASKCSTVGLREKRQFAFQDTFTSQSLWFKNE